MEATTLTICGKPLKANKDGLVSLTDLFKAAQAAGWTTGKHDPRKWAEKARTKKSGSSGTTSVSGGPGRDFIEFVAAQLNVPCADIYATKRGKGGGTFAHWQIALAYAKYLSPELHMQVNEVYARVKSGDVTIAAEIAERARPADAEWLARRTAGVVARNQLTATLSAHGVTGKGYADATNAIYRNVLGGKKSEVCARRGLSRRTNLRDVMNTEQLTATAMSELVARKRIERFNTRGNAPCTTECDTAARSVMALLV